MIKRIFKILLFSLLFTIPSKAQHHQFKFDRISVEQGFSQCVVSSILQDSEGFMWFGTVDGLNKYDGYNFAVYRHIPGDSTSLSSNLIWTIVEDSVDGSGVLWIGTKDNGLNKFDKKTGTFKVYKNDPADTSSLSGNYIRSLYKDKSGTLWIGTLNNGFCSLSPEAKKNGAFTIYKNIPGDDNSLSNNKVMSIIEDKSNNLWIGTLDGLNILDRESGKFTVYKNIPGDKNSLPDNRIYRLLEDRSGNLWIGTLDGSLCCLSRENGKFTTYKYQVGDDGNHTQSFITSFIEDKSGALFCGTMGDGLFRLDTDDRQSGRFTVYKHDPDNENSLSANKIMSLSLDNSGNLWIGTYADGLSKLDIDNKKFTSYKIPPEMKTNFSDKLVWSILESSVDSGKSVWIGHEGAVSKWNIMTGTFTKSIKIPGNSDEPGSNNVLGVLESPSEFLWIGSYGSGLHKYNKRTGKLEIFRNIPGQENTLPGNRIMSLLEDKSGALWIGAHGGGLARLDQENRRDSKFTIYTHNPQNPASISSNIIYSLMEDITESESVIWVGTGKGLDKFDKRSGTFTRYKHQPGNPYSLSERPVVTLYQERSGDIWIGTDGSGLYKLIKNPGNISASAADGVTSLKQDGVQEPVFLHWTVKDGLPNDVILGILGDDHGNLWLATNKGICKFTPPNLGPRDIENFYDLDDKQKGGFRNYDYTDGLQGNEFTSACHRGNSGMMYMGGVNGFTVFHPDSIKDNPYIPPVVITGFRIFNEHVGISPSPENAAKESESSLIKSKDEKKFYLPRDITFTKEITLSYRESVFSLEFASLHYALPEKNQYAFKMSGVDKDWVYCGSRRFATYTNLSPGEYVFRVKGSNSDGVWNEEGASLKIIITPPWWQTWWAYSSYLVLIILVFFAMLRYKLKQQMLKQELALEHEHAKNLREIDNLKSRFYAYVSHEFRTPLTMIKGPLLQILSGNFKGDLNKQCKKMVRSSDHLLILINQLLDLTRLEKGSMTLQARFLKLNTFIKKIVVSFFSLAELKKINLKFVEEHKDIKGYFDRDKLEKVIYNLLSNAIKFTPQEGTVSVIISLPDGTGAQYTNIDKCPENNENDFLVANQTVQITVSDTGIGIAKEQLPNIFNQFYQVDPSQKSGQTGSGIGLALVKEFTELHHGHIKVSSIPGKGTEFKILLPLGKEHLTPQEILDGNGTSEESDKNEIPEISELHLLPAIMDELENEKNDDNENNQINQSEDKPVVLIVEDNREIRKYIKENMLPGYKVMEAENGVKGVEQAFKVIPDLIISDVMMPEIDGFELCKILKTDIKTCHIPIILLTAKSSDTSKIKGLETGADDYLVKPFNPIELLKRVENLIELRRQLQKKYRQNLISNPKEVNSTSIDEIFLNKLLKVVEENVSEPNFDMEFLSKKLGMSRVTIYRKLMALTGQSPRDFIRTYRLNRGVQLLQENARTITEIAYEVGFSTSAHFTKCFKEQFGVPPSKYKRR